MTVRAREGIAVRDPFAGWSDGEQPPSLASRATAVAADESFKQLWQPTYLVGDPQLLIGKNHALRLLSEELGVELKVFHPMELPEELAARVPEAVKVIEARLAKRSRGEIIRDWKARGREIAEATREENSQ